MARSLSDEEVAEIRAIVDGGNKIEAIKQYRQLTGAGLAEAKSAVEAIEAGRSIGTAPMAAASNQDIDEIQAAVFAGDKIKAIKIYRASTGEGLKESKDFIDALEGELRRAEPGKFTAPVSKGCGMAVLAVVVAVCCVCFVVADR